MEIFELGAAVTNVHEWDYEQGLREFIQGWLDNSEGGDYNFTDDTFALTNYNTQLPRKALLAGFSTKRDDDSQRGKFGDGLTSGICVLLREGLEITIYNGGVIWKPIITYSDSFEHEVVAVEETLGDYDNTSYIVEIKGLSQSQMKRVENNTLQMQGEYEHYETDQGTILLGESHKSRIFVGGLFVDMFDSEYGFDFPPHLFELDRDRKSLKPFEIKWAIKDLIEEMSRGEVDETLSDKLVHSMESNDSSMEYTHHNLNTERNESFQKSAEKLYNEKYDGMILTSDYEEADKLKQDGNKNVAFVSNKSFVSLVKKSESPQVVFGARKEKEEISVNVLLDTFEDDWQNEMNTEMYNAWRELSEEIKKRV